MKIALAKAQRQSKNSTRGTVAAANDHGQDAPCHERGNPLNVGILYLRSCGLNIPLQTLIHPCRPLICMGEGINHEGGEGTKGHEGGVLGGVA